VRRGATSYLRKGQKTDPLGFLIMGGKKEKDRYWKNEQVEESHKRGGGIQGKKGGVSGRKGTRRGGGNSRQNRERGGGEEKTSKKRSRGGC